MILPLNESGRCCSSLGSMHLLFPERGLGEGSLSHRSNNAASASRDQPAKETVAK